MQTDGDAAVWRRLLAVLGLTSGCAAMLLPNGSAWGRPPPPPPGADSNTFSWRPGDEPDFQNRALEAPPTGLPGFPAGMPRGGGASDGVLLPDAALCERVKPPDPTPLFCHCLRCRGTAGPKGERGSRGPPGGPGSPGGRGLTGPGGRPGFSGPRGMKGQKGDGGLKGQQGPAGVTGTKGERGVKGEKGDPGLPGASGLRGPQGEAGTCPAFCDGGRALPGTQGHPGPAGARGLPGVRGQAGVRGFKGEKGQEGEPGPPGPPGWKGDGGERGACGCGGGEKGSDGAAGPDGSPGPPGAAGLKGIPGEKGGSGPPGPPGPAGPPGPCAPPLHSSFSACIAEPFPAADWPVAFPRVLSNQPGHFQPAQGIYTAPANGTYVFWLHLAVAQRPLKVGLFHDHRPVARATQGADRSTASLSAVLRLAAGARVWLQVKSAFSNGMFTDAESSSCFSGFLLRADACSAPLGRLHPPAGLPRPGSFGWGNLETYDIRPPGP